MAEINVKSPALKDRDVFTYKLSAQITVGDGGSVTESIDVAGLTIANTAATTFTLSGFEAESDMALDSSRRAGFSISCPGAATGLSATEVGALNATSAVISGTAGSRVVTVTLAAGAGAVVLNSTDSLADAVVEFSLPLKQKDF